MDKFPYMLTEWGSKSSSKFAATQLQKSGAREGIDYAWRSYLFGKKWAIFTTGKMLDKEIYLALLKRRKQ